MLPQEIKDLMKRNGFKLAMILALVIIGIMSVAILNLPKDNPVEQACEASIEQFTGVKIDLTPEDEE